MARKYLENLINYHLKNCLICDLMHILREKCSFQRRKILKYNVLFINLKKKLIVDRTCIDPLVNIRYMLKPIYTYRYPRSNMSYPTKFEKLTFFEKWFNNNVLLLILKSCE